MSVVAAPAAVLELDDVVKAYPGGVYALRGVDLAVRPGELVGIVGPSGSGKSTLLHVMGTLERPSSGRVVVAGHEVEHATDDDLARLRARHIGFVFQQFFLKPWDSALDIVADGLLFAGVPLAERRERAERALRRVGLGARLEHRPAALSGGERQRVAVARAIVGEPSIVLADEPTGNLDSATGAEVMALLRELHADGATLLVITHDREIAAGLPRSVRLRDGRVEA